ncbi:MAG: DUF6356 family protein [Candidatus Colwellbacteria bacterium]|nr:DUF6356 family protein [Candidatus Colwellbacteria bacterium]
MAQRIDAINSRFFSHLTENNISYFDHMKRAFSISTRMIICSVKTTIHGILPYFWPTAATDTVSVLYKELHCD